MTVAENNLGVSEEVELMKNGGDIPVTSDNRLFYISSYSNYMLNVRTASQVQAFTRGMKRVIPAELTGYFFPDEI